MSVFLDLTSYAQNFDLTEYAHHMKQRLLDWIGLPVSIGIGRSKTRSQNGQPSCQEKKTGFQGCV